MECVHALQLLTPRMTPTVLFTSLPPNLTPLLVNAGSTHHEQEHARTRRHHPHAHRRRHPFSRPRLGPTAESTRWRRPCRMLRWRETASCARDPEIASNSSAPRTRWHTRLLHTRLPWPPPQQQQQQQMRETVEAAMGFGKHVCNGLKYSRAQVLRLYQAHACRQLRVWGRRRRMKGCLRAWEARCRMTHGCLSA